MLVSHLGLGTWRWGSETDEDDAADQLISFHEAGGTLVDTGTSYSAGRSEEILGRLLGDVIPREELVIATKAGLRWRGEQAMIDASRGALLRQLDLSLRRLGIDHIDLWQLHVPDDEVPIEETLAALDDAVHSGKVRYVGVSNFTGWRTAQAATWQQMRTGPLTLVSNQVRYSLLDRGIEREVLPACDALGVGVLPFSPLGGGVLTGKYRDGVPADSRAARGVRHLAPTTRSGDDRNRGSGVDRSGGPRNFRRRGGPGLGARSPGRDRADRRGPHIGSADRRAGLRNAGIARGNQRSTRRRLGATAWLPGGRPLSDSDPVFVAFCDAGLWPGLGPKLVPALADAGILTPADVSTANLATLPKVGSVRAGRLLSSFLAAAPVYEVVELLIPAALDPRLASRLHDQLGPPAARLLREDPWLLLGVPGVTIADADQLARAAIPGVTRDDPRRARAIVGFLLARDARDGHTVSPRTEHRGGPASVRCR